jgi:hypothetical protein
MELPHAQHDPTPIECNEVIRIDRDGHVLDVEPRDTPLAARLITESHVAHEDLIHGYRLESQIEPLLGGPRRPNTGLEPVVEYLAVQAGYRVEHRRGTGRPRPLSAPDLARLPGSRAKDVGWLDFLRTRRSGIVRYRQGRVELAWLVGQAGCAFPDARIAVVVVSRAKRERVFGQMRRYIPGVVLVDNGPIPEEAGRIVISSFTDLAHPDIEFEKFDLVIVPDAREALTRQGQLALATVDAKFRLFGLLPIDCKLSPSDEDWIAATFGLGELVIPKHGHEQRAMMVAFAKIAGGPQLPVTLDDRTLARKGIWRSPVRNRRIARVAVALQKQDYRWLTEQAPEVARGLEHGSGQRIAVLVDTIEHALALAPALPEWPIITAADVYQHGLDRAQRRLLAERRPTWSTGRFGIVTAEALATLESGILDVILWAGGGRHLPPIPESQLVGKTGQVTPLLVVDLNDRQHPALRRWTRWRREAYTAAGWYPVGMAPILAKVKRFLAQPPRRIR